MEAMKRGYAPAFTLGLLFFLLLPSLVRAELYQGTDHIAISAKDLPWALVFLREGFRLDLERPRPDERGGSYYFTDDATELNLSVTLAPARTCQTADACRAAYWADLSPVLQDPQAVRFFEENGFAVIEYLIPEYKGLPVRQFNFSAHQLRDGYWIDLHLSKVWFEPKDWALFLRVLEEITFERTPRPRKE